MGAGEGARQPAVADRIGGEHDEVVAFGVGPAHAGRSRRGCLQGEFGPEHGGQPVGAGRLGEAHDAVETVMIGDGEGFETEPDGLFHELLRVRGTIEEAEVGVTVQFGIWHPFCH